MSASENLFTDFEVNQSNGSAQLQSEFKVRQPASTNLFAKFRAAVVFSGQPRKLFSKFFVGFDGAASLYAKFELTEETGLPAEFIVRQSATKDLVTDFRVTIFFVEGWRDLTADFLPRRIATKELFSEFISRNRGSEDLLSLFIIRHTATKDLVTDFTVRHTATETLQAEFIVRHANSVDLKGELLPRRSANRTLFADLEVIPVEHLSAEFTVRHTTAKQLQADFYVRFPTRLWTNRRYINGVIDAAETLIGDAKLENIIEGTMEDIVTFLDVNQIPTYTQWTSIETVPIAIRRAATYGTIASLYSRHTKTWTSRIIPSVAPVTVTVKGDAQEAMEHWESKYELMLNRYLAYIRTGKLFTSTIDEEPVFTMYDIVTGERPQPRANEYRNWHEWLQE